MEKTDPHICETCHQEGLGCCYLVDGTEEQMFGLTQGEIERMAEASGADPQKFTVTDRPPEWFVKFLKTIHPAFLQTMPGRRRRRLRINADGACFFASLTGCTLPRQARPYYCRLYPFWFTAAGQLMVLTSPFCLAQRKTKNPQKLLEIMELTQEGLREIFQEFLYLAEHNVQPSADSDEEPPMDWN